jgi:hypothetical protein
MRSIAAAVARFVSRSFKTQLVILAMAVALVVSGLLVGLPTQGIEAKAPTPYEPTAPAAIPSPPTTKIAVDQAYDIQFASPMNEGSVDDSITIKPAPVGGLRFVWDSTGEVVSVNPATYWEPFTTYQVDIADTALDQSGMSLGDSLTMHFTTGALTSAKITATSMVDSLVSPTSTFQITFTRPVKLATIAAHLSISPPVTGSITGDDPTDVSSQVFTFTPDDLLPGGTTFTVSFDATKATDANGVGLLPVTPLVVQTLAAPDVMRFRPADGRSTTDPNQVISIRFTVPMNRSATASSLSVVADGKAVRGSISWTENNAVLVFDPAAKLRVGSTVYIRVSATARSATGQRLSKAVTSSFRVLKPTVRTIRWSGGIASTTAPWHDAELYYLALMNCTRTGGWVTRSGACSSVTHHTMPAQDPLRFNATIANKVSRPYSKAQADRGVLTHYLGGTTPHSRLCAGGFCGGSWGENLAMPPSRYAAGMIDAEIFFQNEYGCRNRGCEFGHYYNIMNPYFHQAGIGVWVSNGHVRLTIDFYG